MSVSSTSTRLPSSTANSLGDRQRHVGHQQALDHRVG
jgi:hypothetical protein